MSRNKPLYLWPVYFQQGCQDNSIWKKKNFSINGSRKTDYSQTKKKDRK